MSVLSYLESVASALVLSREERLSIATSISTLESRLGGFDEDGDIKNSYIFGSYSRGTILPRAYDSHSDVDYMVVFEDPFKVQPQSRLDWLKRFAQNKYSRSEIHQDYPTIALELNHIRFELVPAVEMGSSYNLQIPAPHTSLLQWINTNPSELARQTEDANKRLSCKFKPLVRILKLWNVTNGRVYSSYQLEQFLAQLVIFGNNLADYLYYVVRFLPTYGISESGKQKVASLQKQVAQAKAFHDLGYEDSAEAIIKRLFPI